MENYYEYINEETIEKNLICNICGKPLIQPVIILCENIFCRKCALDNSKKEFIPVNDSLILEGLDKIQVKCKLCDEINLERGHFSNHIIQQCSKAIISCLASENNCPWIGLREELQTHLSICSYEPLIRNFENKKFGEFLPFSNFNLQERHFHNQDIAIAVKALLINRRCTCLDLFNKGISSKGALIIASVLSNDRFLENLSLRNNLICDSGVQFLAHSLLTNSYLKRLDLNENSITDTGVRLLVNMLKTNETLIKLTLSFNRITNEGMDLLMDVLINYNSTLQWLSLTGNSSINYLSIHSIFNLIQSKQSLKTLNLEDCGFSWWNKKQIYFYQIIHSKSNLDILL
jgi:Ran GTPase-activating protein (RanGAP) involved in mRNA processing and transport